MTELNDDINSVLVAPIDLEGSIAYQYHARFVRTIQIACVLLIALLTCSAVVNVWLARRPVQVAVVAVDNAGRASIIHYGGQTIAPSEVAYRAALNAWTVDRYRIVKLPDREGTIAAFNRNYYYMPESLMGKAVASDSEQVSKILAGSEPEQDVTVNSVVLEPTITSGPANGIVGAGTARIDLTKIIDPNGRKEHQHWLVTARYEVAPQLVQERGKSEPAVVDINPLGVMVTWFHEDRAEQ